MVCLLFDKKVLMTLIYQSMRLTVVLLLLACPFVASLGCDLQNLALGRVKGPSNTNLQTGAHQVSVCVSLRVWVLGIKRFFQLPQIPPARPLSGIKRYFQVIRFSPDTTLPVIADIGSENNGNVLRIMYLNTSLIIY